MTADRLPSSNYTWYKQHCPVCSFTQPRYLGRRGGPAHHSGLGEVSYIHRCQTCGLIFPDPMPVPDSSDEHYDDVQSYFSEHSFDQKTAAYHSVLTVIEGLGIPRGRLLDVGAGRGEGLRAGQERGWEVVGLEPSPNFARAARECSGAEVVEAKLEDRPFGESSFDAVILGAVLEHVFNPKELLAEIHRVLRSGGVLWLDVPNEAGTYYLLGNLYQRLRGRDWVVNLSPTFPPYHVFGFTPRSLRKLLQETGFQVRRLTTHATPAVVSTQRCPVPPRLRSLAACMLHFGEVMGAGTYMDAWATKQNLL
jgi:SAM-dependent methyltransferase